MNIDLPPREPGRHSGTFGAVFGVATIAGPPIGGVLPPEVLTVIKEICGTATADLFRVGAPSRSWR